MADQRWPEDIEFRTFAAKLADSVMIAIRDGKRIECDSGDAGEVAMCPLGAVLYVSGGGNSPYPECGEVNYERHRRPDRLGWLPPYDALREFMRGFDDWSRVATWDDPEPPYYRLGQAYRERFSR